MGWLNKPEASKEARRFWGRNPFGVQHTEILESKEVLEEIDL